MDMGALELYDPITCAGVALKFERYGKSIHGCLRLWFGWAVCLEGELWICQFHCCGFSSFSFSAATKVYHFEYLGTDVFIWFNL
jgi:hypothetical protein